MYISVVGLEHTANYTCYDSNRPQDSETQILIVQGQHLVNLFTSSVTFHECINIIKHILSPRQMLHSSGRFLRASFSQLLSGDSFIDYDVGQCITLIHVDSRCWIFIFMCYLGKSVAITNRLLCSKLTK